MPVRRKTVPEPSPEWCFCGDGGRPAPHDAPEAHSPGCLFWDYAMLDGKLAPAERVKLLDAYGIILAGLTEKRENEPD